MLLDEDVILFEQESNIDMIKNKAFYDNLVVISMRKTVWDDLTTYTEEPKQTEMKNDDTQTTMRKMITKENIVSYD